MRARRSLGSAAALALAVAATACEDDACELPAEQAATLADLASATLVLRGNDVLLLAGAEQKGPCPRLDAVQTKPGTKLLGYGGGYCGVRDGVSVRGCQDVAFTLPPAGSTGTRALELTDASGRIVLEAIPADPTWAISGGEGRYAKLTWVPFTIPFPLEIVTAADAVMSALTDVDFTNGRVLSARLQGSSLEVRVPNDASPGSYRVRVTVYLVPRILRCEGVAGCRFDRPGETPETSALRSLSHEVTIDVE